MKFLSFKHSGSETKILTLDDARVRTGPKMRSPRLLLDGAGSQVSSHSSGSPLDHTQLPQQSQNPGIFAHN
jgi:hypothetical protein